MTNDISMKQTIEKSFSQYAGAVLQSRALVDARDFCKPSLRQAFFCMYEDDFTHSKPFKKTLNAIGVGFKVYIHGDSSLEGIIMRASQQWNMRYPLIEVEGSNGSPKKSGDWAAPRYTASRLSEISDYLFKDLKKDTIAEWRDNYDDTLKYPAVLPSKGFYNLVNGTSGIGVSMASSCPQFNIIELNKALVHLLNHPDCSFDDIYCIPDFASGGILMNEPEVKESLKNGTGKACDIRSKMSYDSKEKCFIVTEVPFMVYTSTIYNQICAIMESDENPGIERCLDLSGETPHIEIYLRNGVNPEKIKNYLFANTALEDYFTINLTMLGDNGRRPKVYGWKELLSEHIKHEKEVYRRGFEYDIKKINDRLHIILGILKAIDLIDEVVSTIKKSNSAEDANSALQKLLDIDYVQAKAILDIKLNRLAHLETNKLQNEKNELEAELNRINEILNNKKLFNKEIEKGFNEVANKFGDARRTTLGKKPSSKEEERVAAITSEECVVVINENNDIRRIPVKSYKPQKRGGKGVKSKGEVVSSIRTNTVDNLMIFSSAAKVYKIAVDDIPEEDIHISSLVQFDNDETFITAVSITRMIDDNQFMWFFTKDGIVKKTGINEFIGAKRKTGISAITLKDGDSLVKVFVDKSDADIMIFTKNCMSIRFSGADVSITGRAAMGVKGITLSKDDCVVDAAIISEDDNFIVFATKEGYGKKVNVSEFTKQGRGGKGVMCCKNQELAGVAVINNVIKQLLITNNKSTICINVSDLPTISRAGLGVKLIRDGNVISLLKV